jgi:hypothetical protein
MKGGCPSPLPEDHDESLLESSSSEQEEFNTDTRVVVNSQPSHHPSRVCDCGNGDFVRIGHQGAMLPMGKAGPHIFSQAFSDPENNTVMLLQNVSLVNNDENNKMWCDEDLNIRQDDSLKEKSLWNKHEVLSMIKSAEHAIDTLLKSKLQVLHSQDEAQASITQHWESVSRKPVWASRCLKHFDDELAEFIFTSHVANDAIADYYECQKVNGLITDGQHEEHVSIAQATFNSQIDIKKIFGTKEEYKSFMKDKGYIVNQQGCIIKLHDAVETVPVDSDEGNAKSNGSSSIENDDGGKEPDDPREPGKNGKWEAVDDADGRRDKRNRKDPFLKAERQVQGGFKSALLVIRPINEDGHLTTEDLRSDDPICGMWMINTTTPFYHQLLLNLTNERRIFVVVKELEDAQDFYHWRDGMLLTRRKENPPFTRRGDCE